MDGSQGSASSKSRSLSKLRILMQMRDNALTHRGGDTVVMERLTENLQKLGHVVDIDLHGVKDPAEYDLVHLYNFCTPAITEQFARNAVSRQTPFVVTTMYEDWPLFFNQMIATYMVADRYIQLGQPIAHWEQLIQSVRNVPPADLQRNEFTGAHASALFPTGENEKRALLRDYPTTKRVEIYHCGAQVTDKPGDPDLFRKEYGITDFVLCVGRLEWRKNQLMIMKALEESDVDLVFLTGGFTYQPEYDAAMRAFRRKGKTHFIGKIPGDMLASAFAGSRCHVLPSWYELPGLVSIEAAHAGTNVVVTDYGTIRDYVGDDAFYCIPDNADSIQNAIQKAWNAGPNPRLQERVSRFTWMNSTLENLAVYEKVLAEYGYAKESALPHSWQQLNSVSPEVVRASQEVQGLQSLNTTGGPTAESTCHDADAAARQGDNDTAARLYREAIRSDSSCLRAHRGLGVLSLTTKNWEEAEGFFHAALTLHPADNACKTGLATARWNLGFREEAFQLYRDVLAQQPDHAATLTYFVNACYSLEYFSELSLALERYLQLHPESLDMTFALAGAYLKEGRFFGGRILVDEIIRRNSTYPGVEELKQLFVNAQQIAETPPQQTLPSIPVLSPAVEVIVEPPKDEARVATEILRLDEMMRKKEYTQALDLSAKLLSRPNLPAADRAYIGVTAGEAHACRGDLIAAETEFRKFDTDSQFGFRAVTGKGVVAAERGKWEEAEAFFRHALSMNPRHDVAVAGVAMALSQKGDEEGAWGEYNRALGLNPENMRAILGVIDLGYRLGRLQAVQSVIENYLEYNPANLSMLYAHAGCLYAQGDSGLARTQLEKITLFEPQHELANELLAKIESEPQPSVRRVFSAMK